MEMTSCNNKIVCNNSVQQSIFDRFFFYISKINNLKLYIFFMHETNKNSISFSDSAIGKYEIVSSHLLSIWICLLKFLLFLTYKSDNAVF